MNRTGAVARWSPIQHALGENLGGVVRMKLGEVGPRGGNRRELAIGLENSEANSGMPVK